MTISISAEAYRHKVSIVKESTYEGKSFKWSDDVLLDLYNFKNPTDGYNVTIPKDVCDTLKLLDSELGYQGDKVTVKLVIISIYLMRIHFFKHRFIRSILRVSFIPFIHATLMRTKLQHCWSVSMIFGRWKFTLARRK